MKKKRLSKADITIQKILDASLQRIIDFGESGLSMTEISRDVGVSRPTIYRYFPTREALLERVFEFILEDYTEKLHARIAADPDPLRRIDIIAEFAEARLLDGGAQLFQLEPKLVMKLVQRSQDRLISQCELAFEPLFEMAEALSGHPVDRRSAAHTFILFNSALAFFNADAPPPNAGDMLRNVIRSLTQFR